MTHSYKVMPLPQHYDGNNSFDSSYRVKDVGSLQRAARSWRSEQGIQPASEDKLKVLMLVIDFQYDFTFPDGALYVAGRSGRGGMQAQDSLTRFIYRNLHIITDIIWTLDSHMHFQIFSPGAHLTSDNELVDPYTEISAGEYAGGKYRPNPVFAQHLGVDYEWLRKQFEYYCESLERNRKYKLYIWPYHCLLGSCGHRLAGGVEEARLFHSFTRFSENRCMLKGNNPLTEDYSVFRSEVDDCFDGKKIEGAGWNMPFVDELLAADRILVAGLASSHCLRTSVSDLLEKICERDPALAGKVYVLRDCTASVVVSGGSDFTPEAEAAFASFEAGGIHLVESAQMLETWPGFY